MTKNTMTAEPPSKAVSAKTLAGKDVHIIDDHGQVDQQSVRLSRGNQDEVRWVAHGGEDATIVFGGPNGSPFQQRVFHVPAAGSVSSGVPRDEAVYDTPYKYTVVGVKGATDPEVIIVR